MPGTNELASVLVGDKFVQAIPPNGNALEVRDAAGARTVVIDAAGALVSALVGTGITYADSVVNAYGTGTDARLSWGVADANANKLLLQLPAGGGTDVPVVAVGQSIEGVDLGYGNGVLDPTVILIGVGARATGPTLDFRKSRGTATAPTVVTTGDDIGRINFYGAVASGEFVLGASIEADMVGTIATTRGPSTLTFKTATDAAPSVLTTALILSAAQKATFTGDVYLNTGRLIQKLTPVDVDAQNNTLTVAQILSGILVHTSVTGGGTVTTDTAANIIAGSGGLGALVADGDCIVMYYVNDGTQTLTFAGGTNVTIADTGATILVNQAAIVLFRRASGTTVVAYVMAAP
jgi:hypothetical protein